MGGEREGRGRGREGRGKGWKGAGRTPWYLLTSYTPPPRYEILDKTLTCVFWWDTDSRFRLCMAPLDVSRRWQ